MADDPEKPGSSLDEKRTLDEVTEDPNASALGKEIQVPPRESRPDTGTIAGTHGGDVEAQNAGSDILSVSPAPVKVHRSQRRGLFGRFTIVAEVEEPKHYSRRTKWFITFVVAMAAVAAPMGSVIFFREPSY